MSLFSLDTKGFRQVFADRPISRMVEELVANAFDENATAVDVSFEHRGGQDYRLVVRDNSPEGFLDLSDAYTVFAPSKKKDDPSKRGRFCFGEKWVIARCQEVTITSTGGRVVFDVANDQRSRSPKRTEEGTIVECLLRTTRGEYTQACDRVRRILVPGHISFTFNGERVTSRQPLRSTEATLPTEIADEDGNLRRVERTTRIDVHQVEPGEVGVIYELGIPVVETGDVFHYDVRQRVPLPINRNNVSPSYLRKLRGAVLDATSDLLTPEQASSKGVTDGIAAAKPETRVAVVTARFGEKRFVTDFNREAGGELFAEGHTPVAPNTFDAETWRALREAGAIRSANQLRPKLYVAAVPFEHEKITQAMRKFQQFAELVCQLTLNKSITAWTWTDNPTAANTASCGPDGRNGVHLAFNVGALGLEWFSEQPATATKNIDLLIHELGHHDGALDCTRDHANEMTRIAAQLAVLMLTHPTIFEEFR